MNAFVKRLMDVVVSGSLLLVFFPLVLLIALAIYLNSGSPVLFRQTRPGYRGRPFTLLKLRTMNAARNAHGLLLSDAERMTRFGSILRSMSLDELPQFWNVLRGDMSLVGPRPLLLQYLDRYTPTQARRHEMKPGMTGWAQVNGRNNIAWADKFALDIWYIDHWNLFVDIRILLRTLMQVVKRNDISLRGRATVPEFSGSEHNKS